MDYVDDFVTKSTVMDVMDGGSTVNVSELIRNGTDSGLTVSLMSIISLSVMFCIIGLIGIVGNLSIIFIILTDRKMRRSVTNLFIMNLAVSDLLIMLFGVPEIVMFMLDRGWLLGDFLCKFNRYVLVFSLYSSVITLVSVCIERYIAIVHPIKAHIVCSRRRMVLVITAIWPAALLMALPVLLFNRLLVPAPAAGSFCIMTFAKNYEQHKIYHSIYKYIEFFIYYFLPLLIQVVCYVIIGKHLFAGSSLLHRKQTVTTQDGISRQKTSDAIKQRKGVVKMLIASVIIYFVSYSPHQMLLIYSTFSEVSFHKTWVFLVFVTAMGYMNSAANPVLYCIFSQNFRKKFSAIFCCGRLNNKPAPSNRTMSTHHMTMSTTDSGVGSSTVTKYSRVPLKMMENAEYSRVPLKVSEGTEF